MTASGKTERSRRCYLEARSLSLAFGGVAVLADVYLDIDAGEFIVLQGPNGCGKTTLLNVLSGHLEPDRGSIDIFGDDGEVILRFARGLGDAGRSRRGRMQPELMARGGMARSWQHNRLFWSQTVRDNLVGASNAMRGETALGAILHAGTLKEEQAALGRSSEQLLAQVGLGGFADRYATQLSLGEARRIGILQAVRSGARVLFLDEPLNGLDGQSIGNLLGLLSELVSTGVSVVMVEHSMNVGVLADRATQVWSLEAGHLMVDREGIQGILRHRQQSTLDAVLGDLIPVDWQTTESDLDGARLRRFSSPDAQSEAGLELRELRCSRGTAAGTNSDGRSVTLSVRRGELLIIEAPNGWGKTTLLHSIAGLHDHCSGAALLDGKLLPASVDARARAGVALLRANDTLFGALTVRENCELVGLEEVPSGLDPDMVASNLSGGQQQRLAWRIFLNRSASVYMIDEAFAHLDGDAVRELLRTLISRTDASLVLVQPQPR